MEIKACEGCYKPLLGQYKTADIRKPHITIRGFGSYLYQKANGEFDKMYFASSKDRDKDNEFVFCSGKCLDDFLQTKIRLRDELDKTKAEQGYSQDDLYDRNENVPSYGKPKPNRYEVITKRDNMNPNICLPIDTYRFKRNY